MFVRRRLRVGCLLGSFSCASEEERPLCGGAATRSASLDFGRSLGRFVSLIPLNLLRWRCGGVAAQHFYSSRLPTTRAVNDTAVVFYCGR